MNALSSTLTAVPRRRAASVPSVRPSVRGIKRGLAASRGWSLPEALSGGRATIAITATTLRGAATGRTPPAAAAAPPPPPPLGSSWPPRPRRMPSVRSRPPSRFVDSFSAEGRRTLPRAATPPPSPTLRATVSQPCLVRRVSASLHAF